MNIVMLTSSYWPASEGGAERQCRKLVDELVQHGHACTVVTAKTEWRPSAASCRPAVRVLRVGMLMPLECAVRRSWNRVERLLWRWSVCQSSWGRKRIDAVGFWLCGPVVYAARWSFLLGLRRLLRRKALSTDVVHVHESSWIAGLGVLMARRLGTPVLCKEASHPVLTPIGYDTPRRRELNRLRRTAFFVAQTDAASEGLRASGIAPDRIETIPNGVYLPDVSQRQPLSDEVLYVGNFSQGAHLKAFDVLLDSWAIVSARNPRVRLTMVGGGDAAGWQACARQLGCSASVHFEGATDAPETYYARATLLVLPSRVEGMSNVLLEALAWGLSVVVSDIPGNTAVVTNGIDGLVVPVNDAQALADAVGDLLSDKAMRDRLGAKARDRVRERFSISHVADRYLQLYRRVMQEMPCVS